MARMLDVYPDEHTVGHLIQDDGGQMSFEYLESWLAQPGAALLSQSLPLRKERFPAKECRDFSVAFCRKRVNAKSSPAIWASARATTTPCLNRSAVNVPGR